LPREKVTSSPVVQSYFPAAVVDFVMGGE